MEFDSFVRTPAECRAILEWRLGRRAPEALRRLDPTFVWYPKVEVLPENSARTLAAYDHRCVYCQVESPRGLSVDFLVPQARGGLALPENLVAACEPCTTARRGKHLDAFLESRLDLDRRAVYARIARATAVLRAVLRPGVTGVTGARATRGEA